MRVRKKILILLLAARRQTHVRPARSKPLHWLISHLFPGREIFSRKKCRVLMAAFKRTCAKKSFFHRGEKYVECEKLSKWQRSNLPGKSSFFWIFFSSFFHAVKCKTYGSGCNCVEGRIAISKRGERKEEIRLQLIDSKKRMRLCLLKWCKRRGLSFVLDPGPTMQAITVGISGQSSPVSVLPCHLKCIPLFAKWAR